MKTKRDLETRIEQRKKYIMQVVRSFFSDGISLLIHYVNMQKGAGSETPTQLDNWQIQPSQNQTRKRNTLHA
jgi:hypothetical protein